MSDFRGRYVSHQRDRQGSEDEDSKTRYFCSVLFPLCSLSPQPQCPLPACHHPNTQTPSPQENSISHKRSMSSRKGHPCLCGQKTLGLKSQGSVTYQLGVFGYLKPFSEFQYPLVSKTVT